MMTDPDPEMAPTTMRRDTATPTVTTATTNTTISTGTPKPAAAVPIHSIAATATIPSTHQRSQHNNNNNHTVSPKVCMCLALIPALIVASIFLAMSMRVIKVPLSFGRGFYALEQPWLRCRCDHDYRFIECRGTRPTRDFISPDDSFNNTEERDTTTTAAITVPPDQDAPLSVLMMYYDNASGTNPPGYTGTSCECATESCDSDTTVCFEVSSYDSSSHCRITNNVTWGESICTVLTTEQDRSGNDEYSSVHEPCRICSGIPGTDDSNTDGYYSFDTSGCGSDFNRGRNNNNNNNNNNLDRSYCVPSLIPNPELLYGAMTPAVHTPNPKLLNHMQTSNAFCNYMTNKYEVEIGGYTCTCIDEESNNPEENYHYLEGGDVASTVECRRPVNNTLNHVKWQRLYWPHGVNDDGYSWEVAPLKYPFLLLLGESCLCSEPTCTVSPVLCTALSYNFETYGCSVHDKPTVNTDDGSLLCGSHECSICELSPGDEDTGLVRVDTSSCNDGQPACRETNIFL
ncbi:hypothetical protein IV203_020154 [Nitzschia inconspicua]|uniref:Uncharacterized protein n=1 Tax=Nitzschia inconspicua TaxID=303405 RepID=A0A9K3PA37_9STRA|nr:hypothetical protein IV203_020344 [Nitzschia inconspicua]KAG7371584.1 hypothetical protein IV203_020154 [Nitzschia inconspicua]